MKPKVWGRGLAAFVVALSLFWSLPQKGITAPAAKDFLPLGLDLDRDWNDKSHWNEDLFVKHLDIHQPNLMARGKLSLRSLRPLIGMVELDEAQGDPTEIVQRFFGSSEPLQEFIQQTTIRNLKLEGLRVVLSVDGIDVRLKRARIPEGTLNDAKGRLITDGHWAIRTGALALTKLPVKNVWQGPQSPLGFTSLTGSGDKQRGQTEIGRAFGFGMRAKKVNMLRNRPEGDAHKLRFDLALTAEGINLGEAFFLMEGAGVVEDVLTYTDKNFNKEKDFSKLALRASIEGNAYRIDTVRLSAPGVQIWGNGKGLWQPPPGTLQLDLTARPQNRKEKSFHWTYP